MLANLLRMILLSQFAATAIWLFLFLPLWPGLAWAGVVLILLAQAGVLALECLASCLLNRADPAPRARPLEWLRAWWTEACTVPQVFGWRQAFLARREPDLCSATDLRLRGLRGVVFVHGFACNRGVWLPWLRRMRAEGRPFVAVNLEPVFGSIEDYVPLLDDAVARVARATGLPPVLVCHSMGGLAARAWLRARRADERVHHVVTIATPHRGTWPARFNHVPSGHQMRLDSPWLGQLARDEPPDRATRFTCWYSSCDNIVFPASRATLPGACNLHVPGIPHVALALSPVVMEPTLDSIRCDRWPVHPLSPVRRTGPAAG